MVKTRYIKINQQKLYKMYEFKPKEKKKIQGRFSTEQTSSEARREGRQEV